MDGAIRNSQLRALGIVPLQLRASVSTEVLTPPTASHTPEGIATNTGVRLQVWLPPTEGDPFAGPHARLLGDVLRSLGLTRQKIQTGMPEKDHNLPLLAFGPGAPADAVKLSTLVKLRDPIEKRIAWKQLRQLRRCLREVPE